MSVPKRLMALDLGIGRWTPLSGLAIRGLFLLLLSVALTSFLPPNSMMGKCGFAS